MFFLTSKWVYESTGIIPHKKKDCKPFQRFLRKIRRFAFLYPYILIFQAFFGFFRLLPVKYSSFIMCNFFVIFFALAAPFFQCLKIAKT